jgi:hypothetical protein
VGESIPGGYNVITTKTDIWSLCELSGIILVIAAEFFFFWGVGVGVRECGWGPSPRVYSLLQYIVLFVENVLRFVGILFVQWQTIK